MRSISAKFTFLTVCSIIAALGIATFISVFSIKKLGRDDADRMLHLICETGAMNLDSYIQDVENSVSTVSSLVQENFQDVPEEELESRVERCRNLFDTVAYNTNGVLTYYFRIDPDFSESEKGFWYVNLDGKGFKEHEVTDITQYDLNDTSELVWFTVPKATGKGVWLPPYITDNLYFRVISYNVPIYCDDEFVGVIGIEIDYEILKNEVENISFFENGYAFILDEDSNIIYHPRQDSGEGEGENIAVKDPDVIVGENHIQYRFEGVEKEAAWLPLRNGMRLYVTVPLSEINRGWQEFIRRILLASLIILLIVIIITMGFARRITKPLEELTEAAEKLGEGNYDFEEDRPGYDRDDEIGVLTRTFCSLIDRTREHIKSLSKQAYVDSLTSVRNKGAYADYIQKLQDKIDGEEQPEFAIGVFDCNNLKSINDSFGHEKGDEYLKAASRAICRIYQHSPVFRIGGDEFAVILENEDYAKREELVRQFEKRSGEINRAAGEDWKKVDVALGMAVYEPDTDPYVIDVARRADKLMYEDKRARKEKLLTS